MQEKIAKIPSDDSNTKTTKKSAIAQSHVRGIAQYYQTILFCSTYIDNV